MKFLRTAVVGAALLAGAYLWNEQAASPEVAPAGSGMVAAEGRGTGRQDALLADAFDERRRSYQVEGSGEVVRLLSDDHNGSRHQRFILRTGTGQTLLVAHNIDLAPRVEGLAVGDTVAFFGEYEWSDRGGVIHWTHHDPGGRHVAGWLRHRGRTYQ